MLDGLLDRLVITKGALIVRKRQRFGFGRFRHGVKHKSVNSGLCRYGTAFDYTIYFDGAKPGKVFPRRQFQGLKLFALAGFPIK